MYHRLFTWILLGALASLSAAGGPVRGDEPKTADEVIAKYIEAIGGRERIDSLKSIRMTGVSVRGGGMETPVTMEFERPDKMRVEFTVQGMTGIQAYDGNTGWFVRPLGGNTDPEKMSTDQVESIQERSDIDGPLIDYKKKGHQVELVGKDEIEGSEAYKLKVSKKTGEVEYYYLDAEHFLLLMVEGTRDFQGTEIRYKMSYGDYKDVNGMLMAHTIKQEMGRMGGSSTTFEKIEMNIEFPADHFAMPEVPKKEAPVKKEGKDKSEQPDKSNDKNPPEDKG